MKKTEKYFFNKTEFFVYRLFIICLKLFYKFKIIMSRNLIMIGIDKIIDTFIKGIEKFNL